MSERNPFLESLLHGRDLQIGKMETPEYYSDRLTPEETRELTWNEFKGRLHSLRILKDPQTGLELVISRKSPTWTYQDLNMYAGNEGRTVRTIEDLDDTEGHLFLQINTKVAQELLDKENREVNVSVGYNVEDNLPGQHSIPTRLHSHIFVSRDRGIEENRAPVRWKDLDWFKRLSVVEPFAPLYRDFVEDLVKQHETLSDFLLSQEVVMHPGYISMQLADQASVYQAFPEIKALLHSMRQEYEELEQVFTDKRVDHSTNRYIPRLENERRVLAQEFTKKNESWLSQESIDILYYLASNLRRAEGGDYRNMGSAGEAWLTKGFAGMINFSFSHGQDTVRFDILPRVMTTSSASKILAGQENPTVLARGSRKASLQEQRVAENYQQRVMGIVDQNFPSLIVH